MYFFPWNVIFPIGCNSIFEKCAGPADRKVRFRIFSKNYCILRPIRLWKLASCNDITTWSLPYHIPLNVCICIVAAHHRSSYLTVYRLALVLSNYVLLNTICTVSLRTLVANGCICNPVGWRLQPTRGSCALVSPPLMSSRHRILEPYGRWHATVYNFDMTEM